RIAQKAGVDFLPKVRIGDKELVDILNRALMMVYAPRLEPFGFAPLEANACGLPVVAVAEGGVRETIIDVVNGLIVEHDTVAMAGAIERLMLDGEYATKLGENGRRIVEEKWSLSFSIDRLESRFNEVMAKVGTVGINESGPNIEYPFAKKVYWKLINSIRTYKSSL